MIRAGAVRSVAAPLRIGTVTLNAAIDKRYVVQTLRPSEVIRVLDCTYSAGGKGLNVARVARLAGAQVLATGFLGGHAGDFIAEQLALQDIHHDFVRVEGESRSCINISDAAGTTTELLEPGIVVHDEDLECLSETYRSMVERVDVVVLSGSAPRGCPPDIYVGLVLSAQAQGKPVLLDSSGDLLRRGVEASPSLVKPNADEARSLMGSARDADAVGLARALVAAGIERVVLSRGAQGAVLVTADGAFIAAAPSVTPVNTVGCGDAMVAGLALGLGAALAPDDLLRLAVAMGSAAAMSPETGSFRMTDLDDLLREGITVRHL